MLKIVFNFIILCIKTNHMHFVSDQNQKNYKTERRKKKWSTNWNYIFDFRIP